MPWVCAIVSFLREHHILLESIHYLFKLSA